MAIQLKLKEHLSVDILEKALFHEEDLVIPLPKASKFPSSPSPHVDQPTDINKSQPAGNDQQTSIVTSANDQGGSDVPKNEEAEAVLMKVPSLLDVEMIISSTDVITQV